MAGDWIPREEGLGRKPEILRVARSTGKDRRVVVEALMEFWEWADGQTADGRIAGLDLDQLTTVIDGTDAAFWLSVVEVGWLKVSPDGLVIPNFERWLGRSAKKRLQKNARQAEWRSSVDAPVDARASTKAPTTEEKRREQKRTSGDKSPETPSAGRPPGDQIPPELDTEDFRKAWAEWCQYRKEARKALTPSTTRKQLTALAALGRERAIRAIEESIRHGWQGIFEPKGNANGAAPRRSKSLDRYDPAEHG